MNRALVAVGIGERLVLEAVARPDLVDPDGSSATVIGPSDERRVHRPLDAGDLDLDPAEQRRSRPTCSGLPCAAAFRRRLVSRWSASNSSRVSGRGADLRSAAGSSVIAVLRWAMATSVVDRREPTRTVAVRVR